MEFPRQAPSRRTKSERIRDFCEFEIPLSPETLNQQAARCMDCGVPHCHAYGCPVQNRIPDFNEMVWRGQWRRALALLESTINFPEFTGRICPAPCEAACTLMLLEEPVTIRHLEAQIVAKGWQEGWIQPRKAAVKTGKRVAVAGSGPAGLAAAQQLARAGHEVILFERSQRIGGLMRYGIPDFKLEKWVLDRRLEQLKAEGVIFETNVNAGIDLSVRYMQRSFDAIVLAIGAGEPRELDIPGRHLAGIYRAMEYLTGQNKKQAGIAKLEIDARGKRVVVIGGGDTGSDCVGTAVRQGAREVTQIELLPQPPAVRAPHNPWPAWPQILRTSSSQEEGCTRRWSLASKEFAGADGRVCGVEVAQLAWSEEQCQEIAGTGETIPADLVLLALGFLSVEHSPLIAEAQIGLTARGTIEVDENSMTSMPGIFAAGDAVRGATLVVRAIQQGRAAAAGVQRYLAGDSGIGL